MRDNETYKRTTEETRDQRSVRETVEEQKIYGQIYVLIDPTIASITGGYIRYPGKHIFHEKSDKTLERSLEKYRDYKMRGISKYFRQKPDGKNPQMLWLREMNDRNISPTIKSVETCYSLSELNEREKYWIAFYRKRYSDLLNISNGGDGGYGENFRMKGRPSWNKGKTIETDDRIKPSWSKGLTKETDERLVIAAEHMSENHFDCSGEHNPMFDDHRYAGDGNPMAGKSCKDFMTEEEILLWKKHLGDSRRGKKRGPYKKNPLRNPPWNKGKKTGIAPWNKGLSADPASPNYDERVAEAGKSVSETSKWRKEHEND